MRLWKLTTEEFGINKGVQSGNPMPVSLLNPVLEGNFIRSYNKLETSNSLSSRRDNYNVFYIELIRPTGKLDTEAKQLDLQINEAEKFFLRGLGIILLEKWVFELWKIWKNMEFDHLITTVVEVPGGWHEYHLRPTPICSSTPYQ